MPDFSDYANPWKIVINENNVWGIHPDFTKFHELIIDKNKAAITNTWTQFFESEFEEYYKVSWGIDFSMKKWGNELLRIFIKPSAQIQTTELTTYSVTEALSQVGGF